MRIWIVLLLLPMIFQPLQVQEQPQTAVNDGAELDLLPYATGGYFAAENRMVFLGCS